MVDRIDARCTVCGATFPRGKATTETKGELACPIRGANDVRSLDRPDGPE